MSGGTADLVLTGAAVWCGGPESRRAGALAVRGNRIVAVGTEDEVRQHAGSRTEHLHLPGRLVVPGFQDAHVHPPQAGRNRLSVDLDGLPDRAAYLEAVARYAAQHPERSWIFGGGWSMEHFPGGAPVKEDLDRVVPDRPVFLFNRDVHGAWVNSRALELAGITRHTPDPPDGRIERDAHGEPTGTLHEGAAYTLNDTVVPAPDPAELEAAILSAQEHLHRLGITGWQDAWVTPETQRAYESLAAGGRLTARVVGALWWDRHRDLGQVPDLLARRQRGRATGHGRFFPTTVKIMADGVLENGTGALLEPYCDGCGGESGNSGLSYLDRDELAAAVTALDAEGFQVHVHTIGDRAVRDALDAVAAARAANGPADRRHHLAHVQLIHPDDLPRFAELGVVANCQAYWAQHEPQMDDLTLPVLGDERSGWQYPFADLLRAGARLAMGSDWPVTTPDPLQQIEVAVTRVDPADRSAPPFLPEQRLSLTEALTAFTSGSAYVNHDDGESGRLAPGMRADLAVLDTDLFADGAPPVADARVEFTVAAGRVVHQPR
ncbi:hypothetical protein SAMN04515665_11261 [Blastococcus sp. DSM 46786]|uniref:amidohydrolase n=1 Tax=Blastococcus sp. DSM 46786 TaxID=1798227 RepID=UPI0008AADDA0|nr:amidohydrolase [Blastococcus sp. DSM 46786]SEL41280.1 hypothetical protein SAMN04515665_11261 [Blastococcus sp. DSM 46786]